MNIIQVPFEHKMFQEEFYGVIDKFIYDEFVLSFTEEDNIVLIVAVFFEEKISGTQIQLLKAFGEFHDEVYYEVFLDENSKDGMEVFCNKSESKYTNIGHSIAQLCFRIVTYIMATPRERVIKPKPSHNFNKKQSQNKIRKKNKIYLLDEIVEYVNENGLTVNPMGVRKINCPCWSVRGHYRHYKNGNVVFVKSYEKGKEKGRIKSKDSVYFV